MQVATLCVIQGAATKKVVPANAGSSSACTIVTPDLGPYLSLKRRQRIDQTANLALNGTRKENMACKICKNIFILVLFILTICVVLEIIWVQSNFRDMLRFQRELRYILWKKFHMNLHAPALERLPEIYQQRIDYVGSEFNETWIKSNLYFFRRRYMFLWSIFT